MKRVQPLGHLLKPTTPALVGKHQAATLLIGEAVAETVFSSVTKITKENRELQAASMARQLAYLLNSVPLATTRTKAGREELIERIREAAIGIQVLHPEDPVTPWELLAWTGHDLAIPGGASLFALSTSFVRLRKSTGPASVLFSAMEAGIWGQNATRWSNWVADGKPDLVQNRPPNMVVNTETGKIERVRPTLDGPWVNVHERLVKKFGAEFMHQRGWSIVLDYIERAEAAGRAYHETWEARKGGR